MIPISKAGALRLCFKGLKNPPDSFPGTVCLLVIPRTIKGKGHMDKHLQKFSPREVGEVTHFRHINERFDFRISHSPHFVGHCFHVGIGVHNCIGFKCVIPIRC
jgi:hypothetical protein